MTVEEAFSKNLKQKRDEMFHGNTSEFSKASGVARAQLHHYISGDNTPGLVNAWKLAQACKCTVNDLLEGATE